MRFRAQGLRFTLRIEQIFGWKRAVLEGSGAEGQEGWGAEVARLLIVLRRLWGLWRAVEGCGGLWG